MASSRPFNLVRWFSLLSFGTLAVIGVVTALLLSQFIENRLLALDAQSARDFVQSVTRVENADVLAFEPGAGGPVPHVLAEYFSHVSRMPDVVRTNVYSRDKTILWSSDQALIGRHYAENDELDEALGGEVVFKRGHVGAPRTERNRNMTRFRRGRTSSRAISPFTATIRRRR